MARRSKGRAASTSMGLEQLQRDDLLELKKGGGTIRFGGQRAVILDVVALGLLRKELIETLGTTVAKGILTRFGWAHGARTARGLEHAFAWRSKDDWRAAGGRMHRLQGQVSFEPVAKERRRDPHSLAEALWHESYEAEQHVLHLGQAEEPVCWTLTGFASGYLSTAHGEPIVCVEERCVGQGHACCWMVGRRQAELPPGSEGVLELYRRDGHDDLTRTLRQAEKRLWKRTRRAELVLGKTPDPSGLIAHSPKMKRVLELAHRTARFEVSVLIYGESGTGKERVARLLHQESTRAGGPFVAINCAALAPALIESELFGHARGAFTGAVIDRPGVFEEAHRGTLFLDEIGELEASAQAKLLRAIQEREIRRVGENQARPIDVRIVCATNRRLEREVAAGRFREDLYFRLRVVELELPPLRERPEDLLPLAQAFLARLAARPGGRAKVLSKAAARRLAEHRWPGNVRELENAIERAWVVSEQRIEVEDLPPELGGPGPKPDDDRPLEAVERAHVLATLDRHAGHRKNAAAALGVGEATLYRMLKRWRR
jgi:two-component system response regulator HydG